MKTPISREEAADGLREQAASCRRLSNRAGTSAGSAALNTVPTSSTRMRAASARQASGADVLSKGTRMNNNVIDQGELDRLRIKRVPTEMFVWGDYRYSNAQDAIAAARRAAEKR